MDTRAAGDKAGLLVRRGTSLERAPARETPPLEKEAPAAKSTPNVNIAWLPKVTLPLAVSVAARWVRRQECTALRQGVPLSTSQLADARLAGVSRPEHIRLMRVESVAELEHALLKPIALVTSPLFAQTAGLTARYGILIRSDRWSDRALLVHELAHVAQYQRLGGIRPFLRAYLQECHEQGYPFGPLEREAAQIAATICPS